MNSQLILKSDILDIIFEKRNKAYGAYTLRKLYPGRLKFSLGIMLIIASAFSALILVPGKRTNVITREYFVDDKELTKIETKKDELPKKQEHPKTEVKQTPAPTPADQTNFIDNIKIVAGMVQTDSIRIINDKTVIGHTTVVKGDPGPPIVQPVKSEPGLSGAEPVKVDRSMPLGLDAVDLPPSFPGGIEALLNFLRKHLNNPEPMVEGESVNVKVTFVVGYEGKLQSFKITEDGGDIFNKEVIRVLKKMPGWVPGKARGENVSVYYSIPVKFTGAE